MHRPLSAPTTPKVVAAKLDTCEKEAFLEVKEEHHTPSDAATVSQYN